MNLLFVCSRNRLRSPTAEVVFGSYPQLEVLSAGTATDAEQPVSSDLIEWADVIFAMERVHHSRLTQRFGHALNGKKVIVLGIRDIYRYMDPELVSILREKVGRFIPLETAQVPPFT